MQKLSGIGLFSALLVAWVTACTAPAATVEELDCDEVTLEARDVLDEHCHRCHGQDGKAYGGLNFILQADKLIAAGLVVAQDAASSPLLQRIQRGEMPPAVATEPISEEDVASVEAWIECGAPALQDPPDRPFVSFDDLVQILQADLNTIGPSQWRFTRYITLTHLYNSTSVTDDSLQTYRHGLSKLLNSLSWNVDVVAPVAVDPPWNTIFRIHLADYAWHIVDDSGKDGWDRILDAYPYGFIDTANQELVGLTIQTKTALPFVTGDWLVTAASVPPLYHRLLRLPTEASTLESLLFVDVNANIDNRLVMRAGFVDSGISQHNRMFERHDSPFGAYYKSYDFSSSLGSKNILVNPLGPLPPFPFTAGAPDLRLFAHDGGEIIFTLPNGLHGYMLIDAAGQRIDVAPTNIVMDPKQPDGGVRAGRSCSSCHAQGIIVRDDEVRDHLSHLFDTPVPQNIKIAIEDLYPEAAQFRAVQQRDQQLYLDARQLTGIPANVDGHEGIPIDSLAQSFLASLGRDRMAAELWTTGEALDRAIRNSELLSQNFGVVLAGKVIKRENFRALFPQLVCLFRLGSPLVGGAQGDLEATACPDALPPK